MVANRYCLYPRCKSDSRQNCKPHMSGVFFIPFPKPKSKYQKCVRWLRLCGKNDPITVKAHWYICSKHFVGGKGPTEEHPDPISCPVDDKCGVIDSVSDLAISFGWSYGKDGETQVFSRIQGDKMLACLQIKPCGELTLVIYNKNIQSDHPIWEIIPKKLKDLSSNGLKLLLEKLKELSFCGGNSEKRFFKIFSAKKLLRFGFECSSGVEKCIRSNNCLGLFTVDSKRNRCLPCDVLRRKLRDYSHYEERKRKRTCQNIKKESKKQLQPMKKDAFFKMEARNLMSLKQIFKEQKRRNEQAKGRRGVKWHPDIIQFCRALRSQSPKSYETLRKTGFSDFPSRMTLLRHASYSRSPGFHDDAFKELFEIIATSGPEEHRRYVCIVWDEVKTTEKLDYIMQSGECVGFLPKHCSVEKDQQKDVSLATHIFQIMVRGITSDIKFPLAFFPSSTLLSSNISNIVWEAVMKLEKQNIKVLAFVSDGAAANRTFFHTSAEKGAPHFHKCQNPFAIDEKRNIYFISDVNNLIKSTRNCLYNSFFNYKSRTLWNNGKNLSWLHVLDFYKKDSKAEIRMAPKLTFSHIYLNAYSLVSIKLAAEVLSAPVASGIESLGDDKTSATVKFLNVFHTFFDIMNVKESKDKNNPDLEAFSTTNDARLKWLKDEFIDYLNQWEYEVEHRYGSFTETEKNKMLLNEETREGLKRTVLSVAEIIEFLLNRGAPFVLTSRLNLHSLENEFGSEQKVTGSNDKPNILQFMQNRKRVNQIRPILKKYSSFRKRSKVPT